MEPNTRKNAQPSKLFEEIQLHFMAMFGYIAVLWTKSWIWIDLWTSGEYTNAKYAGCSTSSGNQRTANVSNTIVITAVLFVVYPAFKPHSVCCYKFTPYWFLWLKSRES